MKYNLDPNKQTNLFLRKLNEQDKTIQQATSIYEVMNLSKKNNSDSIL